MVAEATVGSVLLTVLVVGAFVYFLYRRIKASRDKTTGSGTGGGGSKGDGGNVNQV